MDTSPAPEEPTHINKILIGVITVLLIVVGAFVMMLVSVGSGGKSSEIIEQDETEEIEDSSEDVENEKEFGKFKGGFDGKEGEQPNENEPDSVANSDGLIPILFSVHTESSSSRICDGTEARCATDEEWEELLGVTERMIEAWDRNGLKATFQMQISWMTRLQDSDRGRDIIQSLIDGGHEIAIHHHGFTHNDWNGYSDDPESANGHDIYTDLVAKPMSEYMEIVHAFEDEWGVQITTVEGTDLMIDRQPEWIFQTGDDGNNPNAQELNDPHNYCPEGRPTWSSVTLPNSSSSLRSQGVTSVGHTWLSAQTGDCTRTVMDHVLDIINSFESDELDADEVVNFVLHPKDLTTNADNEDAFMEAFDAFGSIEKLVGMTVQEYMCERVGKCI